LQFPLEVIHEILFKGSHNIRGYISTVNNTNR